MSSIHRWTHSAASNQGGEVSIYFYFSKSSVNPSDFVIFYSLVTIDYSICVDGFLLKRGNVRISFLFAFCDLGYYRLWCLQTVIRYFSTSPGLVCPTSPFLWWYGGPWAVMIAHKTIYLFLLIKLKQLREREDSHCLQKGPLYDLFLLL